MLTLEGIARDFADGKNIRRVLFPTDLEMYPGELTVLAGPSGSGKTTLLSIMGLVLSPTEGELVVQGKNVTRLSDREAATFRKQNYGFVFQQAMLIDGLNTLENVLLSVGVQGARPTSKIKDRAVEILQLLGLGDALHAQPAILSGGQKQRVSIARALVKDPPIVLCDEPTSALDAESGQVVLDFLKKIALEEKKVVVVVSHDARVFPFADRLIKLEEGRIVSDTREPY